MTSTTKTASVLCIGIIVRLGFILFDSSKYVGHRVEIVSPLTAKKRITECISLLEYGISPYQSDICHQPPLVILLFQYVATTWLFLITDILTAAILYKAAELFSKHLLKEQQIHKATHAKDVSSLLLSDEMLSSIPLIVMTMYLLNPYSLLTFSAESSIMLNNFLNAVILLCILKGWFGVAACFVSISSYLSVYGIMFMAPVLISSYHNYNSPSNGGMKNIFYPIICCTLTSVSLVLLSYQVFHSWDFIQAVYGFTFEINELTPNMGLFWYFFMETFDHFRSFFLWVFQINAFIYVIPLTILFRNKPALLFYILLSLVTLLKSYSNMADVSLPLSILPLWGYAYRYMRNVLLNTVLFVASSVLAPVMWYLWIYAGSGNSNFFYAITLIYSTAQIFLIADVSFGVLRYDFHLINGLKPKTEAGEFGEVLMK